MFTEGHAPESRQGKSVFNRAEAFSAVRYVDEGDKISKADD